MLQSSFPSLVDVRLRFSLRPRRDVNVGLPRHVSEKRKAEEEEEEEEEEEAKAYRKKKRETLTSE